MFPDLLFEYLFLHSSQLLSFLFGYVAVSTTILMIFRCLHDIEAAQDSQGHGNNGSGCKFLHAPHI